jgi:hypothetical protein
MMFGRVLTRMAGGDLLALPDRLHPVEAPRQWEPRCRAGVTPW